MENQVLQIKNMVCDRCIDAVRELLADAGTVPVDVRLGAAEVEPGDWRLADVETALKHKGFELIRDSDEVVVEHIRQLLIAFVRGESGPDDGERVSSFVARHIGRSYSSISRLFSKNMGLTLERYCIALKVERAKELIEYGQLSNSEIAYELRYRTTQHLANQFKSVTGMSMSDYRAAGNFDRKSLDKI